MSRRPRVLIVDDCETSLLFEELALCSRYQIVKARCGRDALRIAGHGAVDAVLLDLGLPDLAGLELLGRLRQGATTGRLPVIVVTVAGDDMSRRLARLQGCSDYLTKPVPADALLRSLRLQLAAAKATASPAPATARRP